MKEEIAKEHPDQKVTLEYMLVDLGSFRSVKDFTVAFKERNLPLHVLINNAGILASDRGKVTPKCCTPATQIPCLLLDWHYLPFKNN